MKASCKANGVKKFATEGTSSLSFDRSGLPTFWCSTVRLSVVYLRVWKRKVSTVIIDDFFDVTEDLSISTLGHACLLLHGLALWFENGGRLRVQNERNC